MSYKFLGQGILVLRKSHEEFPEVDSIAFDCDGTLIDSSNSYYLTTRLTTCIILKELCNFECKLGKDFDETVRFLEMLGGFNNDWNKAAIMIQAIFLHLEHPKLIKEEIERVDVESYLHLALEQESEPQIVKDSLAWIKKIIADNLGKFLTRNDLEKILDEEAEKRGKKKQLKEFREKLGPITRYGSGILTTLYDEIYLGEQGVKAKYGVEPKYVSWNGAIEKEKVLIREEILEELRELIPKGLAIITGRGKWEVEKTLGPLTDYFNVDASIFVADQPVEREKPDPAILIECAKRMGSKKILYVGDSAEDLLMVKAAAEKGIKALFAGVLTNENALGFFVEKKADAIVEDVNDLPRLFKREEAIWKPF